MEDERETELSSISAIFPEIVMDPLDPFSVSIDIPVSPSMPLPVVFLSPPNGANMVGDDLNEQLETYCLSHLPSLHLRISLPKGYPSSSPPSFNLSTTPQWLPTTILEHLESDGIALWEDSGHDQVVFAYIDHLQRGAEDTFGVLKDNKPLQVLRDHRIALLNFDTNAKHAAFEKKTFVCGVCLDPKKGSACYQMLNCGDIFCRQCLQDFYNNAINEADLASIKCLSPGCANQRNKAEGAPTSRRRKLKTRISPRELLQIPIEEKMVRRYVVLKRKAELESDKNIIYCPRKWCQGAARSSKHRRPSQLVDDIDSSEDESEAEKEDTGLQTSPKSGAELLSICEDCSLAFCNRCYQGWHGEFTLCAPRTNTGELTEEDVASLEYLKLHTTPCPTCAAPTQKTHGCNHMICFKCQTHFCYLCSAWLDPSNPYRHFNLVTTSCYMRLWELEEGDGDDVGIGYNGGIQAHEAVGNDDGAQMGIFDVQPDVVPDVVPDAGWPDAGDMVIDAPVEPPANPALPMIQEVAREGPLVLRIGQAPPRAPPEPRGNVHPPPQRRGPVQQPNHRPGGNLAERPAGARHAEAANYRRQARADQQARVRHARPARNAAPPAARRRPAAPADGLAMLAGDVAAANQRWVENFVRLALADEEDLIDWDSDDEEDLGWQIPVR